MGRRRGATLMEMLIAMVLLVVLIGATTALYGFTVSRTVADTANASVVTQATSLAAELEKIISQSTVCDLQTSGGNTALRCQISNTGTDTDGDGLIDSFTPTSVSSAGLEVFTTGKYVWFYRSSAAGSWGTSGQYVWRATPSSSSAPAAANLDTKWSLYYGGSPKWNLIDGLTFSVDAINRTTTFTISASALNRAERTAASGESLASRITITRTVFWSNAR